MDNSPSQLHPRLNDRVDTSEDGIDRRNCPVVFRTNVSWKHLRSLSCHRGVCYDVPSAVAGRTRRSGTGSSCGVAGSSTRVSVAKSPLVATDMRAWEMTDDFYPVGASVLVVARLPSQSAARKESSA
jgi:hypothetical protein